MTERFSGTTSRPGIGNGCTATAIVRSMTPGPAIRRPGWKSSCRRVSARGFAACVCCPHRARRDRLRRRLVAYRAANWHERLYESRVCLDSHHNSELPRISTNDDGLYHGERLDLNKVDLGAHLNGVFKQKLPGPRISVAIDGQGDVFQHAAARQGSAATRSVLEPEDPRDPLLLEFSPPTHAYSSAAIEVTGGSLEVYGLRMRVNPNSLMPAIIHVSDGDLTMRFDAQRPALKPSDSFQTLITMSHANDVPATLLLATTCPPVGQVAGSRTEPCADSRSQQSGVSLANAFVIDANRPTLESSHVFDHNTLAARQATFLLRTGPALKRRATCRFTPPVMRSCFLSRIPANNVFCSQLRGLVAKRAIALARPLQRL